MTMSRLTSCISTFLVIALLSDQRDRREAAKSQVAKRQ